MLDEIEQKIMVYCSRFATDNNLPYDGSFSYKKNRKEWDLYGSIDILFALYTTGLLGKVSTDESRRKWARKILSCQNDSGFFEKRNETYHSKEHATAYAISALKLLFEKEDDEITRMIKPIPKYRDLVVNFEKTRKWLKKMGFSIPKYDSKYTFKENVKVWAKHLGWNHIWPASHIGGGVAAAVAMAGKQITKCTEEQIDGFFNTYVNVLNKWLDKKTGLWKRSVYDKVNKSVRLGDVGGAVHFYWIYDYVKEAYPYPEQLIRSCLGFENNSGLIKEYPFCIDFDFTYCVARSFKQLPFAQKEKLKKSVDNFLWKNGSAVIRYLVKENGLYNYSNSHGLPGALASIAEVQSYLTSGKTIGVTLNHPFDKVCWL